MRPDRDVSVWNGQLQRHASARMVPSCSAQAELLRCLPVRNGCLLAHLLPILFPIKKECTSPLPRGRSIIYDDLAGISLAFVPLNGVEA